MNSHFKSQRQWPVVFTRAGKGKSGSMYVPLLAVEAGSHCSIDTVAVSAEPAKFRWMYGQLNNGKGSNWKQECQNTNCIKQSY